MLSESCQTKLSSVPSLNQCCSGNLQVIEQGAVILGGVEQDFGFGLRQQYFHKTAILIVEHEESTFTKAIILNRPTDIMLDDDLNPGTKWRVWFGGDVQGLDTLNPSILCLHSLKTEQAVDASVPVMKDIQWTSFDSAKKLVKAGHAKPSDFWTFAGYAGWAPGQLMGELERKSWYMVATDSQTLLKELARLSEGADPRDAGLDTWELLMNMIGRGETAKKNKGNFDDLMLKEWAREHLLSEETGGGAKATKKALKDLASGTIDRLLGRAEPEKESVSEGTLIRASSADRSPFLLERQELHKSIVLIILENEAASIGVVLSRPASAAVKLQIAKEPDGEKRSVELPLRFGGQYSVKGNDSLLWLHCNAAMRQAKIGSPFEAKPDGIWKCTADDMIEGISKNLASPEDFMVVSGVSLWTKGSQKSLSNEIEDGTFEIVPDEQVEDVWDMLVEQTKLSTENLEENLDFAEEAWAAGASSKSLKSSRQDDKSPLSGLGEGFDEEDDSLVFKSDVRVADLSDDALRNWIATFLLDEPIR